MIALIPWNAIAYGAVVALAVWVGVKWRVREPEWYADLARELPLLAERRREEDRKLKAIAEWRRARERRLKAMG